MWIVRVWIIFTVLYLVQISILGIMISNLFFPSIEARCCSVWNVNAQVFLIFFSNLKFCVLYAPKLNLGCEVHCSGRLHVQSFRYFLLIIFQISPWHLTTCALQKEFHFINYIAYAIIKPKYVVVSSWPIDLSYLFSIPFQVLRADQPIQRTRQGADQWHSTEVAEPS